MEVNSYLWKWFKSHAQGIFALRDETKMIEDDVQVDGTFKCNGWQPRLMEV